VPKATATPGNLWVPRLLPSVGPHFGLVGTTRKVATYGDCPQEAYVWRTWIGVKNVCVVCIKFSLRVYIDLNHRDSWI
jgi:hypothetical protein